MQIISDLPVGGAENLLLGLLPKLLSRYEVQVCCIRERGVLAPEFERAGIPVAVKYFKGRWHPASLYRLASYMREQRIDIVHTHMYRPNISGVLAAKLAGIPIIISHIHSLNHWDTTRQLHMDARVARFRDKIIMVSEVIRKSYISRTKVAAKKCTVIYNGIDLAGYEAGAFVPLPKEELGIGRQDKVVGIVARLSPEKDHVTFIQAARRIKNDLSNVKFLIVGPDEAKLLPRLKKMSVDLGLADDIIFMGLRSDIPRILSLLDVSVLSSTREGFPIILLESMAAGAPMAATDVGGNAEAIADGKTGFLAPPKSPELLAEAILKILRNPEVAASMKQAALQRAKSFTLDTMVRKIEALYEELLGLKGTSSG